MDIVVDWLLDPLALLFLLSLPFGVARVAGASARGGRGRGAGGRAARRRPGWRLAAFGLWIGGFLVASAPAIVNPLVAALEARHPADIECPGGTPVVVLGGGIDSRARDPGEVERMRPATLTRVAAAERLARAEPGVTLVLSGGGLGGDASRVAEADVMARFLVSRGIEPRRLVREAVSSDTAGNAREVAALLSSGGAGGAAPAPDGRAGDGDGVRDGAGAPAARLVTSAIHMERALATFRAAGVRACPVPVGPIAIEDVPLWALMPQTTALVKFDQLLHELLAIVAYRLRGDL